jgi:propionyl-CoA carboxylase beta chain
VVKSVTHEDVSVEELGGATVHASKSGVIHYAAESGADAIEYIKKLLSYIPQNNMESPPFTETGDSPERRDDSLNEFIPDNPNQSYDMKEVIRRTVDNTDFLEIMSEFAPNLVIGFARYDGYPVGIVANQPEYLAGVLDIDSSVKGARFVRFCDWVSAGHGTGIRRRYQEWGQNALRLCRGNHPQSYGYHPQGIRWGILRHVLQASQG